jgi:hypothetical protein
MSQNEFEEDIELMKTASPEELYQLIATDPPHYLKIIEDAGAELQHLFRCLLTRNQNQTLSVKFKIFPEDRWVDIGYFEDMSDAEVYKDFQLHVDLLLKRTHAMIEKSQRPHIEAELGDENDITSTEYKGKKTLPDTLAEYKKDLAKRLATKNSLTNTNSLATSTRTNSLAKARLDHSVNVRLDRMVQTCPLELRRDFDQLIKSIEFYQKVREVARTSPSELKPLFDAFLDKVITVPCDRHKISTESTNPVLVPTFPQSVISDLDEFDLALIKEHKIDLSQL